MTATATDLRRLSVIPISELTWLAKLAGLLGVYWWVLVYSYIHAVSPINEAEFSMYLRPSSVKELEGVILALLCLPTVNREWRKPSDFGLSILYFIGLVPTLALYGLADQPRTSLYIILAGFFAVNIAVRAPVHIPPIQIRQAGKAAIYIAMAGVLVILSWFAAKGDLNNLNLDLLQVYDFREDAGQLFSGPLAYLAGWTPRVLLPFLFCYFLFRKRWGLFALTFAVQFSCLVIFQEKSVFIPCVALALLYWAPPARTGQIFFALGMIASIVACNILLERFGQPIPSQIWTRRFFFDQQFLYFNYIDIFSKIGFVYYSDSFLSSVIHYPFLYPPANMISYYTTGNVEGNANTGFLGAGYMEMGFLGVVMSGFLAGLVLKLFDRVTPPDIPMWFLGTAAFLAFDSMLITQNFFTSLSTGGVAMLFVLMLFLNRRGIFADQAGRPAPESS